MQGHSCCHAGEAKAVPADTTQHPGDPGQKLSREIWDWGRIHGRYVLSLCQAWARVPDYTQEVVREVEHT